MQTPGPEGSGERALRPPPLGHGHGHSTGGGGPRGHETLGRGTPPAADLRPPGTERRAGLSGTGGEACSSESPLPSLRTEEEDLGPATGPGRKGGGGGLSSHAAREGSPAPSPWGMGTRLPSETDQ